MTHQFLTHEVEKARESWLQAIWSVKAFSEDNLMTTTGVPLKIIFQGWKNQGAGADFTNARLWIGDKEMQGDVEIHLHSSLWNTHQHQHDLKYNSVILHVVLKADQHRPCRQDGNVLLELELKDRLQEQSLWLLDDPELWLQNYDQLPGLCGVEVSKWSPDLLLACLNHAGKLRMLQKAEKILETWHEQPPDEILYRLLLRACGQTKYALAFEQLAHCFPLADIQKDLSSSFREGRMQILARWFGACHLLEDLHLAKDASVRREQMRCLQIWKTLTKKPDIALPFTGASRPYNSPQRRLVGVFHHLHQWGETGLLKGWLKFLLKWSQITDSKRLIKTIQKDCNTLFKTPNWEVWNSHFNTEKATANKSQLLGKSQQNVIWNNAIIPFFLAYAKHHQWKQLETLLETIFSTLNHEPSNNITRFMAKRLAPASLPKSNSSCTQQGLLHLHHQYCQNFESGCHQCKILPFLKTFQQQWDSRE